MDTKTAPDASLEPIQELAKGELKSLRVKLIAKASIHKTFCIHWVSAVGLALR